MRVAPGSRCSPSGSGTNWRTSWPRCGRRTCRAATGVLPMYLDAALLSACEDILHLDLVDDANGRIWVRDGLWSAIKDADRAVLLS